MQVRTLDHVNIRSARPEETVAFFTDVLGMVCKAPPGAKPGGRGGWVYDLNDPPVIHIGPAEARYPGDDENAAPREAPQGSGAIHHLALECVGFGEMLDKLKAAGLSVVINEVPQRELRQIFVDEPNGVTLELNFRGG
jgi:catechol 2,3-dioxygenase-like lactoylglutathione lyase family enzyme